MVNIEQNSVLREVTWENTKCSFSYHVCELPNSEAKLIFWDERLMYITGNLTKYEILTLPKFLGKTIWELQDKLRIPIKQ